MFLFGCCVGSSGAIDLYLGPSLQQLGYEPLLQRHNQTSIFEAYNSLMDEAASIPGVEGLVLVHDDVEIRDEALENKLRAVFADDSVGLVGVVGGRDHPYMPWFENADRFGRAPDSFESNDFGGGLHSVDTVDGLFLAISPWALDHVRFDGRGYPGFHGYDAEICATVRASGRQVFVTEIELFHHCKAHVGKSMAYRQASYRYLLKWRGGSRRRRLIWRTRHVIASLAVRFGATRSW